MFSSGLYQVIKKHTSSNLHEQLQLNEKISFLLWLWDFTDIKRQKYIKQNQNNTKCLKRDVLWKTSI